MWVDPLLARGPNASLWLFYGFSDEGMKEWMRLVGFGLQLRMKLYAYGKRVFCPFYGFNKIVVGGASDFHTMLFK